MAETSWPFDAGPGANITEQQWRQLALTFAAYTPGVIPGQDQNLEVFADSTGLQVKLRTGRAAAYGTYYRNDSQMTLSIAANNTGQRRIDAVVIDFDYAANTATAKVLTGTTNPPTLSNDIATRVHVLLAYVLVPAGATTIASGDVYVAHDRWAMSHSGIGAVPIGGMIDYMIVPSLSDASAPPGWIIPRGQTVSQWNYMKLAVTCLYTGTNFGVNGMEWGYDAANEQIVIPDLRGRVGVGRDAMGGSDAGRLSVTDGLGRSGGSELHTLSTAELPSHTHGAGTLATVSAGSHTHPITGTSFIIGSQPTSTIYTNAGANIDHSPAWNLSATAATSSAGAHTHDLSGSTAAAGSGSGHNNMPPYVQVNKLMRIA